MRKPMGKHIEVVCNECLRPVGTIRDVIDYPNRNTSQCRIDLRDCDCSCNIKRQALESNSMFTNWLEDYQGTRKVSYNS